jgi:dynein heavy chain
MEILSAKFNGILNTIKKKPYDFLDQRRTDFDIDYEDFKKNIQDLHVIMNNFKLKLHNNAEIKNKFPFKNSILSFIDNQFERIQNTDRSLQMLRRFEKLDLPNMNIQEKYARILTHYAKDIEQVSKIYQKSKQQPPVARDLPPIAGKILWSRQLYRRISQPMEVFEANKKILKNVEAKKIIKNYNQLSAVLIEYEVLYHRTWLRQVEIVLSGIHSSLIIKHPETNEYLVNFDPEIITLIRETECMKRLKLDVPKEAENLITRQEIFKHNYDRIKVII